MPRPRKEIGSPGLPIFAGYVNIDPNANLRGVKGVRAYRDMSRDEPAAVAFLAAAYQLFRTDTHVEAGGTTDADKCAAEHLETCIDDMRHNIATYLRQMDSFLWAGWCLHEPVFKRRNGGRGSKYSDGRVGWSHWGLRRQESLYRWTYDPKDGVVTHFQQRPAPTFDVRIIPLQSCIHLVADEADGSPEGQSALRGMYRQAYFVKNLELLWAISMERFGTGIPVFELTTDYHGSLTAEDKATIEDIAAGVRQNEEAYIVTPSGIKFRFEPSPGLRADDYRSTVESMRTWMLTTVLADFMALGGSHGSGAYELGRDKSELFLLALNSFQERKIDAINRQAVTRLFRIPANDFGELTDLPRLSLPAIKRYDLEKIGTFAKTLSDIGALHITPDDEAYFRRISDMLDIDPVTLQALHDADDEEKDTANLIETDEGGEPLPAATADPSAAAADDETDIDMGDDQEEG